MPSCWGHIVTVLSNAYEGAAAGREDRITIVLAVSETEAILRSAASAAYGSSWHLISTSLSWANRTDFTPAAPLPVLRLAAQARAGRGRERGAKFWRPWGKSSEEEA